jgi:hypothetical protein
MYNLRIIPLYSDACIVEVNQVRKTGISNLYKFYSTYGKVFTFWEYLGTALINVTPFNSLNTIEGVLGFYSEKLNARRGLI